jgi:3-hydroxybutyryl-CoA dehydrogenase
MRTRALWRLLKSARRAGAGTKPTLATKYFGESMEALDLENVAVVGGGTMGTGIVYTTALSGAKVWVVEPDERRATAMRKNIDDAITGGVRRGKLDAQQGGALTSRIRHVKTVAELPKLLNLVIETVPERLELKHRVLGEIASMSPDIIASNTSALSIDRLAEVIPFPERFLGMHFFNPVWSIRLVELVRGRDTSEATLEAARAFVAQLGKESLTVLDVPGFATSRLDLVASLEAMRMLESGVASAADIDRAAVLAYQHPVGPLRLSDIVGLDVRLDIARTLEEAHGSRFAPPQILINMVARGELGQKSGKGFFDWAG